MKVLQVSKFYPPVMGGIESVAWELTEGLNRAGIPTDVLCSNQQLRTTVEVQPLGYRVTRASSMGMVLSTSMAPALASRLHRLAAACDLIHLHMPDPMAALALWATRPGARVVVHWHSDVVRQRRTLRLYEPLQRWVLRRADAIIATSEPYARASAALRPWLDKVSVIPVGVSDNRAVAGDGEVAAIRQRFGRRRIIFALGRMTYYKGFDVLIEAAAALPDDCVVVIGGDGELLDTYRAVVAKRGLAGKVHLPGPIGDSELPGYFEACDVFCMPSTQRAEAYGVAMVEAMAMGRPVVATDIAGSGVPWVNVDGETGFNVPVGDPAALARALKGMLSDTSLRERLGAGARSRYARDFSADMMTSRTVDLYQRLLPTA